MARALTVLIVDDEPPIRRLLRTTLTADDYRVVEAENGATGLRLTAVEKPDLVILDLGSARPRRPRADRRNPQDLAGADHRAVGAP